METRLHKETLGGKSLLCLVSVCVSLSVCHQKSQLARKVDLRPTIIVELPPPPVRNNLSHCSWSLGLIVNTREGSYQVV